LRWLRWEDRSPARSTSPRWPPSWSGWTSCSSEATSGSGSRPTWASSSCSRRSTSGSCIAHRRRDRLRARRVTRRLVCEREGDRFGERQRRRQRRRRHRGGVPRPVEPPEAAGRILDGGDRRPERDRPLVVAARGGGSREDGERQQHELAVPHALRDRQAIARTSLRLVEPSGLDRPGAQLREVLRDPPVPPEPAGAGNALVGQPLAALHVAEAHLQVAEVAEQLQLAHLVVETAGHLEARLPEPPYALDVAVDLHDVDSEAVVEIRDAELVARLGVELATPLVGGAGQIGPLQHVQTARVVAHGARTKLQR